MRLAARLGFCAVEFDVMLTADGVPVLMHDETLDRTTDGHGRVAEREWAEIARLDAGCAFHPAWSGEPVPRLSDALDLCVALGLAANVEIKPADGQAMATGRAVAEAVLHSQRRPGPALLLSSFSEKALLAARDAAPALPRALLVGRIPEDWAGRLQAIGATALHARADALSAAAAEPLQAAGVALAAYTVNSAAEAARCFGLGAAALFTDRLDSSWRA